MELLKSLLKTSASISGIVHEKLSIFCNRSDYLMQIEAKGMTQKVVMLVVQMQSPVKCQAMWMKSLNAFLLSKIYESLKLYL